MDENTNNDPDFKGIHRKASRITVSAPRIHLPDPEFPSLVMPVCDGRVITVNGEIWEIAVPAFGANEGLIAKYWDRVPSKFTRKNE